MQKKIIALAIAGLASSAAFAQTNVVIYGVADVGYANVTSDRTAAAGGDAEFSGMLSGGLSGSRLGFKATEDLGGGLSAGMLYEMGTLNVDGGGQGASTFNLNATRQSYVFLGSKDWGTFQGGRIYTSGTNTIGKFDPEGSSFFGPVSRLATGAGSTINAGSDTSRLNNSVAWLSPNWKGFTAQVQYSWGEAIPNTVAANATTGAVTGTALNGNQNLGTTDDQRFWGLGADYTNGPMAVGFAYHDFSDYGNTIAGAAQRDLTEWLVGASYDFGMLKLTGAYQDFDGDNMATIGGAAAALAKIEGDIWTLGVVVPVFKSGTVTLSYADLDRSTTSALGVKTGADADGWGITYRHAMSKRTTAYIGYTTVDNSTGSAITVGGAGAPTAGKDSTGYMMGMRHTF